MLNIILQANIGECSFVLLATCLLILLFIAFHYFKKIIHAAISGIVVLSLCFLAAFIIHEFMNGNFMYPDKKFVFILIIFLFFFCIFLVIIGVLYHNVVSKKYKNSQDILKRKKYVNILAYGMALFITALLFRCFGIFILQELVLNDNMSYEQMASGIITSGLLCGMIVTVFVFLSDNIIARIASTIYTTDEARELMTFCLYLRSFSEDKNYQERLICKVTNRLYPVYAIGDPNRVLQPNGAGRVYATDDEWKDIVKELSFKSKLILLRIGQTDGTLWEITNIIKSQLIHKTIFLAYNSADLAFFVEKMKLDTELTANYAEEISGNPIAFFWDADNHFWYRIIKKKRDIENLINEYLSTNPSLDKEYEMELELRHHNLTYMFDKQRIPSSVRRSLNWTFVSPLVGMRHWSYLAWGVFLYLPVVIGAVVSSTIPIYLSYLFLFLFGNRIEWAAGSWSCDTIFLKTQRREAKLLWLCFFMWIFFSLIYMYLLLSDKN